MFGRLIDSIRKFLAREESATTLNYGLMIALIAVACWAALIL